MSTHAARSCWALLLAVLIAGCASDSEPPSEPPAEAPAEQPAPLQTVNGPGGRYAFRYDTTAFDLHAVEQALPPAYEAPVPVQKLIPVARAAQLGEEACRYGARGIVETCTADKESGIGVGVLPRAYEAVQGALDASLTEPATVAGRDGVRYAIGAEGGGAVYLFAPLPGDATLVVYRSYSADAGPSEAAFEAVRSTLRVPAG